MNHKSIKIQHISLFFPHKICFQDFSAEIPYGSHIAIIGRNGSGKSSLLEILLGHMEPTEGTVVIDSSAEVAYVPQVINSSDMLSGGQRFNEALTMALSKSPNVLLLDEPTNHLDASNRKSLMRMLKAFQGTLIIVSHDVELLHNNVDTLWHIDHGHINTFTGNYNDYLRETAIKRQALAQELACLDRDKKEVHQSLMKEQQRASKSRAKGEKSIDQRKWPTVVSKTKALSASETSGRKKADITKKRDELNQRLSELHLTEIILPKFSLTAADIGTKMLVSVNDGTVEYPSHFPTLTNIHFSVSSNERVALMGDNGSGKTTLIKAILHSQDVITSGEWTLPKIPDIGYLDQHYGTLQSNQTVLECIREIRTEWTPIEARRHLNDFLFRKNEEINALVSTLSGGEKARLSLAKIAAKTPRLLILDEMTNNIDLETREHIVQVLKIYPGAMIIISHDEDFLKEIGIKSWYRCCNGGITCWAIS